LDVSLFPPIASPVTFLPLLLLAVYAAAPVDVDNSGAKMVFSCAFDNVSDENQDGWPDNWTRRTGSGYPHYVDIKIADGPSPTGKRCLRIDLDGGGAVAYSPPINVGWFHGYVLEAALKTENLVHDRAFLSVTLLDGKRRRLATFKTEETARTDAWRQLRLGPIEPNDKSVAYAVIGLHVEPGEREDIKGAALFGDLRLSRIPRMSLRTSIDRYVFTERKNIDIQSDVSGFGRNDLWVAFRLEDVHGHVIAQNEAALAVRRATSDAAKVLDSSSDEPTEQRGIAHWNPPTPGLGFYRVRADLNDGGATCSSSLAFVVVQRDTGSEDGEFGWTLPQGDRPLPLPVLGDLIDNAGVRWVKYPLWQSQATRADALKELFRFTERLASGEINLVGVLDQPPAEVRDKLPDPTRLNAAEIFTTDSKIWHPSVESVMTQFSARVEWWQLGRDNDASFAGIPSLEERLKPIKAELDRVGGDTNLGIGWSWGEKPPGAARRDAPLRFVALSADAALTPEKLGEALEGLAPAKASGVDTATPDVQRWVTLQPLERDKHGVDVRAADLVRRMMAAKIHGADGIFLSDPFDAQRGLFDKKGLPDPLFLAWRTTALALGGGKHLGGIDLPGRSPNEVFARCDDAVMVVWSKEPREEALYLGDQPRQVDVWGRVTTPKKAGDAQVIAVGPIPTFVVGLSEPVARWRKNFAFAEAMIPSVPGKSHGNAFRVTNTFPVAVKVRAKAVAPEGWQVQPDHASFTLAAGARHEQPLAIGLPYDVNNIDYLLRIDFVVEADREYRFSVYRCLSVGLTGIKIEYNATIDAQGQLVVTQRLVNATKGPVSFRCQLQAPGRQGLETQVVNLAPGTHEKTYLLANGTELIGKTLWLRAEEIGGVRKLNYQFVVGREMVSGK
jgi:hypothetical protein